MIVESVAAPWVATEIPPLVESVTSAETAFVPSTSKSVLNAIPTAELMPGTCSNLSTKCKRVPGSRRFSARGERFAGMASSKGEGP